jgi:hypothetical protein
MNMHLGDTLSVENKLCRVVRIIQQSYTLFESEDHTPYILQESYVQLKTIDGKIKFIVLEEFKQDYTGATSPIKALEPYGKE